jgi:hypothetical protein
MDETALMASFHEFSVAKGWEAEKIAAASSIYSQIRDEGPAAVLEPTNSENDANVIARADALLKSDPAAYWRDEALQEAALEAREHQLAAPPPEPGIDHDAIERRVAQQEVDRFAAMLRQPAEAAKYWASAELQERHHRAIAASIRGSPGRRAVRCHARRSGHAPPARRPGAGEGRRLRRGPQDGNRGNDARGRWQGLLDRPGRPARVRRGARAAGRAAPLPASTGRRLGGGLVESRGRLRPVDYRAARSHAGIVGPATCCVFIAHSTCFASRSKMTCTSSVATQYSYPGVRGVSHESIACGLSNMCSSFLL